VSLLHFIESIQFSDKSITLSSPVTGSLYDLPVASSDLTQLQQGIQFFTDAGQASAQMQSINDNRGTVFGYAQTLLENSLASSQVAMADFAYATGKTDTVSHLGGITLNFLPAQVHFAEAQNFLGGPTVYAAQVYALAIARDPASGFAAHLTAQVNSNTFVTTT